MKLKEVVNISWPYLRRYWKGTLLGLGALAIKDMAGVVQPLLIREGIDSLTGGFAIKTVYLFAIALVGLSILKGLFQYWMRVILVGISREIEYDLRNDLYAKLSQLSWNFYSKFRTGDVMARATNDLNAVRMMMGPALMYWVETLLTFVLAVGIMMSVDWKLTLIALSPAPLISIVVVIFGGRIHRRFEAIQGLFSDISSRVQENFSGVRIVRAYAQEEAEEERFASLNRDYIRQNLRLARLQGMFMPLLQALVGLTFLAVLWAGGLRLLEGKITLGTFVMFSTYMGMLVWPLIAFGWVVNLIQRGSASLRRIHEILNEEPLIRAPQNPKPVPAGPAPLEFHNVTVSWGGLPSLQNVNLRIEPKTTVAVVGRTGSGKTNLVQLLPRLFDPVEGSITYGGIDLREFNPSELRQKIGFVPQETFLFSSTLAENIAFGVNNASPEQIANAADLAGLAPDIQGFPKGLETEVGERGLTLSGGQKQRTAIARAVLREPEILILDDALASVDTETEERILRNMDEFLKSRTAILISHRVSTLRTADRILVLEAGRIVEDGTHDELIAKRGYYAELASKQQLEEELEII